VFSAVARGNEVRKTTPRTCLFLVNCCDQIVSGGVKAVLIYFFSRICVEISVIILLLFRNLVEVKGSLQVSF
jgi:hypothetical protein